MVHTPQGELYMQEHVMATSLVALGYQHNWWQILTSGFMRNALVGGTIVALAAGLIGYFVIVRNTAFAAHALAHIGFPGATGAVLVGLPVALGLGVFCVGGALVIGALGKRAAEREVATGTVLAMATGLGLFFNSLATRNSSTMTNVLFGNLLAIIAPTDPDVRGMLLALLAVSIGIHLPAAAVHSVNAEVAEAKGVPVRALSVVFMVLLGLAVTMAVQAVGTLLLFALVVTPAATAIMLTAAAGGGDGHLHRHRPGVGVGGARAVGDVQHAAELRHRHHRLWRVGCGVGDGAWTSTGGRPRLVT